MNRFFQRVREKALNPAAPAVTVVAFGDSVTQGVMEHHQLDGRNVYHRLLQDQLEAFFPTSTFSTLNAGVGGQGLTAALTRLEGDVLGTRPDLVLIAFGLNDALEGEAGLPAFREALRSAITTIQARTSADIIVVTPPFMARRASTRIHPEHAPFADRILAAQNDGHLASYAQAERDVANGLGVAVADVHREWQRLAETRLDTDLWLVNGLNHPDPRGHQLAATVIFHRLLAARDTAGQPFSARRRRSRSAGRPVRRFLPFGGEPPSVPVRPVGGEDAGAGNLLSITLRELPT